MAQITTGVPPAPVTDLPRETWGGILTEHIRRMGRVDDLEYLARAKHFISKAYEDIAHEFHHYAFDAETPPSLELIVPEDELYFYSDGFIQVPLDVSATGKIFGIFTQWLNNPRVQDGMPIEIGIGSNHWASIASLDGQTEMTVVVPAGEPRLVPSAKTDYRILSVEPSIDPRAGVRAKTLMIGPKQRRIALPRDLYIVFQPQLIDFTDEPVYYEEGTARVNTWNDTTPGGGAGLLGTNWVTGLGTSWESTALLAGTPIELPKDSGIWYTVDYFDDDTNLYLTEPYLENPRPINDDYRILRPEENLHRDVPNERILTLDYNEAHRHFADTARAKSPGVPKQATRYGRYLYLDRPADKPYFLNLLYYRHPTPPMYGTEPDRADATFPEVDRVWDEHIVEKSLYLAHKALFRPDLAKEQEEAFQSFAEAMPQLRTIAGSLRQDPDAPTRTFPHGGNQG